MNILYFTIPGKPKAKQRSRKGKHGNWYNPQEDEMGAVKKIITSQLPDNFKMIEKKIPIEINCLFLFNPVKSEKNIINSQEYCKKPDRDNCDKFLLDCMSKIVFYDDNQVWSGRVEKRYTLDNARTEVEVKWQQNT